MTNDHKSIKIIIARYSEDLSWLNDLDLPYVVYNKGDQDIENSIKLENIGREAHTYFTHIVDNYYDLEDYSVFLQGNPFFHMDEGADVFYLQNKIAELIHKNVPFKGLSWFKLKCDEFGRPHKMNDPESKGKWKGWGKDIPVGAVYSNIFNRESPSSFIASAPTGLFVVRKDRILTRPLSFYQKCLSLIVNDPFDENNTGHAFERLWQAIFNGSKILNP